MESSESPLDVLSRAATMVQDNILPPSYEEARPFKCKELPLKWRRDRHPWQRPPPEYPHKTTPTPTSASTPGDTPLDMSTRRPRGSPPSYSQSLSHVRRPTVITTTPQPTPSLEDGDVSDPVIDEHFRRSLGKDYMSLFADNGKRKNKSDSESVESSDLSGSALSVDDHFAKALGETWLKLQKGESSRHRSDTVVTM